MSRGEERENKDLMNLMFLIKDLIKEGLRSQ